MKVEQKDTLDQEQIGHFSEIESSIREEDMGFALAAVSENLYSNPIGSFIRELVSNAVDANKDNNKATKVKVFIYSEDGNWYFKVVDEGLGMTPFKFNSVYMSWFNSDKRENNAKIGGWGLGSKSPLSYQPDYELTTVAEGIKYDYLIVKQHPLPTATLLREIPTSDPSGTTVKLLLKEEDLYKVLEECEKQLIYFDNVIVNHQKYYYKNDFTILEADLFKVRPDSFPFRKEMHISLGNVAYPINWKLLNRPVVNCPVALKFEIGDLPVTLSREDIKYQEQEVIDKISNKIDEVLNDLLSRKKDTTIANNLFDYLALFEVPINTITLSGHTIPFEIEGKRAPKRVLKILDKDIVLTKDNAYLLLSSLYSFRKITTNKTNTVNIGNVDLSSVVYNKEKEDNHWSNLYYKERVEIRRKKLTRRTFKDIAKLFNLSTDGIFNRKFKSSFIGNNFKTVYNIIRYIDDYIIKQHQSYSYVPLSFIEEEKRKQKELLKERKGNITYYDIYNTRTQTTLEYLLNNYSYVFYINREEDLTKIAHYDLLYRALPNYFKKKCIFVILSPTTIKTIKKYKTFKPYNSFWKISNLISFFNRIKLSKEMDKIGITELVKTSFGSYYDTKIKYLSLSHIQYKYVLNVRAFKKEENDEFFRSHTIDVDFNSYFKKELDNIPDYRNTSIKENIKELSKVCFPLLLLTASKNDTLTKNIIKQYKLTKLNLFYYEKANAG